MRAERPIDPRIPVKNRMSLRLGLLFVGTFVGVLTLLMAWTVLATVGDRRQVAAGSEGAAPVIVIDPQIKADLAKALAFDSLPVSGEVLNPFLDRAGLGNAVGASNAQAATQSSSSGRSSTSNNPAASATLGGTLGMHPYSQGGASVISTATPHGVKARYDDWLERQKRGDSVGPEAEVLSVEDLVPVGYASGGNIAAEVMLYSPTLCKTFSFTVGSRFFDGWLNTFDQNEVVFVFENGYRRKSYARPDACAPDLGSQSTDRTASPAEE